MRKLSKTKPTGMDGFLEKMEKTIADHGFMVLMTSKEIPEGMLGMFYTVGLHDKGLPEIITFGLPPDAGQSFLNLAAARLIAGELPLDTPIEKIGNLPVVFKAVDPESGAGHLNVANSRAEHQVPAIQLFWSDTAGLFPWDTGYDVRFLPMQPLLHLPPETPEEGQTPSSPTVH